MSNELLLPVRPQPDPSKAEVIFSVKDSTGKMIDFCVDKETICNCSEILRIMVRRRPSQDISEKICIQDIDAMTFSHIINYVFKSKIEFASYYLATKVAHASYRYRLNDLYKVSIRIIISRLDPQTLPVILQNNYRLHEVALEEEIFKYASLHIDKLKCSQTLSVFSIQVFHHLVQNIYTQTGVIQLFELVVEWFKQYSSNPNKARTLQNQLGPILSLIKFLRMTPSEFEKIVVTSKLIPPSELDAIRKNLGITCGYRLRSPVPTWCNREAIVRFTVIANRNRLVNKFPENEPDAPSFWNDVDQIWCSKISVSEKCGLTSAYVHIQCLRRPSPIRVRFELESVSSLKFLEATIANVPEMVDMNLARLTLPNVITLESQVVYEMRIIRLENDPNVRILDRISYATSTEQFPFRWFDTIKYFKVQFFQNAESSLLECIAKLELSLQHPVILV